MGPFCILFTQEILHVLYQGSPVGINVSVLTHLLKEIIFSQRSYRLLKGYYLLWKPHSSSCEITVSLQLFPAEQASDVVVRGVAIQLLWYVITRLRNRETTG